MIFTKFIKLLIVHIIFDFDSFMDLETCCLLIPMWLSDAAVGLQFLLWI